MEGPEATDSIACNDAHAGGAKMQTKNQSQKSMLPRALQGELHSGDQSRTAPASAPSSEFPLHVACLGDTYVSACVRYVRAIAIHVHAITVHKYIRDASIVELRAAQGGITLVHCHA